VNALLKKPLPKKELLPFAMAGEKKASGAAHADNVAPSLFGGACIIRNEKPVDVIPFSLHKKLRWIILSPHLSISTSKARSLLPKSMPLSLVCRQMGNISGLVLGLQQGEAAIIQQCMVDHIAEPLRRSLIPAFSEVKEAALTAGALGCSISGSGPAIFAVTLDEKKAHHIAEKMQSCMLEVANIASEIFISGTNLVGAKLVTEADA
jgi:homoserine kinase